MTFFCLFTILKGKGMKMQKKYDTSLQNLKKDHQLFPIFPIKILIIYDLLTYEKSQVLILYYY